MPQRNHTPARFSGRSNQFQSHRAAAWIWTIALCGTALWLDGGINARADTPASDDAEITAELEEAVGGKPENETPQETTNETVAPPGIESADIDAEMVGNACRCATYHRIRAAIHHAAKDLEA